MTFKVFVQLKIEYLSIYVLLLLATPTRKNKKEKAVVFLSDHVT